MNIKFQGQVYFESNILVGSTAENECYYRRTAGWVAHFSYDFLIKITINNQQINRRKSNIRCYSIIVRNGIFTCLAKRLSLHVTKKADSDYEIIIESLFSCCLFCIHYAIKPFMDLDQLLYFYYTLEQDLSIKRILQ